MYTKHKHHRHTSLKNKETASILRSLISRQRRANEEKETLSKYSFRFLYPIGKGGFGRVWKVEHKRSHKNYALKEMLKLRILSKRSVHSVMNERQILEKLSHAFIVNMHFAFQDKEKLYLALDLLSGGDLRYHLIRRRGFSEDQAKFIVACIILGLEHIHANGILHRDIKPENLVFDSKGYLRITDFGIARVFVPENSKDTSGTPGYMAPEVIVRQNHGPPVDYFALGIIAYELMMGRRPYLGRSRKEIRDQILSKQVCVRNNEIPKGWTIEAADFVNQLIQRKPSERLTSQAKNHPWFYGFPWTRLTHKILDAPFVPPNEDNFDSRVNSEWKEDLDYSVVPNSELFAGYAFEIKA